MPDQIIGSGADGTTNPILQENDPLWDLLITGDEPIEAHDITGGPTIILDDLSDIRPNVDMKSQFKEMIPILAKLEEALARKTAEGTPTTVTLEDSGPDFEDFRKHLKGFVPSESTESGQEAGAPTPTAGAEPQVEIELGDEEQVFGISFPASMLPLSFNYGYWESEPILDPNGDPEAALVRVWLYPPNQPGDPMISDESSSEANTPQETEGTS